MDPKTINKIIKLNNPNPPVTYFKNPLLDENVALAFSKSVSDILRMPSTSKIVCLLKAALKDQVQKVCGTGMDGHLNCDDLLVEIILKFFAKQIRIAADKSRNPLDDLDQYLFQEIPETRTHKTSKEQTKLFSPDLVKACLILSSDCTFVVPILKDYISLRDSDPRIENILQYAWASDKIKLDEIADSLALRMKGKIQERIQEICINCLKTENHLYILDVFMTSETKNLIEKCSISPVCFRMCCEFFNINYMNFQRDKQLQSLIQLFIENVKILASKSFISLYEPRLQQFVVLMDCELSLLKDDTLFIDQVILQIKNLQKSSISDFIMLTSHYPVWEKIFQE